MGFCSGWPFLSPEAFLLPQVVERAEKCTRTIRSLRLTYENARFVRKASSGRPRSAAIVRAKVMPFLRHP